MNRNTMRNIIIADNLTNDYCNSDSQFSNKRVNIGKKEVKRVIGLDENFGKGPLPNLLNIVGGIDEPKRNVGIILIRDYYDPSDDRQRDDIIRYGEHNVKDSFGAEFIEPVKAVLNIAETINSQSIGIDLKVLRDSLQLITSLDILNCNPNDLYTLKVLLTGFHTEKRLLSLSSLLRNYIGIQNIAVSPHLMASTNSDAHYNTLRYYYPDARVNVIPDFSGVVDFLEIANRGNEQVNLQACRIDPEEVRNSLSTEQKDIIERLCMHWDKALIKPLKGGFSGSLLLLAEGWKEDFRTEPMVLKIDTHIPIKKELDGYQLVKDLLGKHVPTFSSPVTSRDYAGISMELASMEGRPLTLQDYFESATNDYELAKFLSLFTRSINLLAERVYGNTVKQTSVIPYRQFLLHIVRQGVWLSDNIGHILNQKFDDINIDTEVIKRMFDLVRKNDDSLVGKVCLTHGDLNLANIICDERENIWAIDWTYTDVHPLEMDFAKLENDIKFVISKRFEGRDFSRIQTFENYLLSKPMLPEIEDLPANLQFVSWDLRFKKVFLTVKNLRDTFIQLNGSNDWLIYRIGLLRYATHTLSFDQSRNRGECGPVQLWYALYSVEQLLFQLVSEDFHLKIRGEKPDDYPPRFRISIDQSNWKVTCDNYSPPYYVRSEVLNNDIESKSDGWAHPENISNISKIDDFGVELKFDKDGRPLNPRGRTGIVGRGALGRWGINPYLILVVTRINQDTNKLEILLKVDKNESLGLLEDFVKFGSTVDKTKIKMIEKILPKLGNSISEFQISNSYFYDHRQTDNAWIFADAYSIHMSKTVDSEKLIPAIENYKWEVLSSDFINNLSASRAEILNKNIENLSEKGLINEATANEILRTSR